MWENHIWTKEGAKILKNIVPNALKGPLGTPSLPKLLRFLLLEKSKKK